MQTETEKIPNEQKVIKWLGPLDWVFAKTYAKTFPHEYVVVDRLSATDKKRLYIFVKMIREFGYDKNFFTRVFKYLEVGGYKYWTMDELIMETTILNREPLNKNKPFGLSNK